MSILNIVNDHIHLNGNPEVGLEGAMEAGVDNAHRIKVPKSLAVFKSYYDGKGVPEVSTTAEFKTSKIVMDVKKSYMKIEGKVEEIDTSEFLTMRNVNDVALTLDQMRMIILANQDDEMFDPLRNLYLASRIFTIAYGGLDPEIDAEWVIVDDPAINDEVKVNLSDEVVETIMGQKNNFLFLMSAAKINFYTSNHHFGGNVQVPTGPLRIAANKLGIKTTNKTATTSFYSTIYNIVHPYSSRNALFQLFPKHGTVIASFHAAFPFVLSYTIDNFISIRANYGNYPAGTRKVAILAAIIAKMGSDGVLPYLPALLDFTKRLKVLDDVVASGAQYHIGYNWLVKPAREMLGAFFVKKQLSQNDAEIDFVLRVCAYFMRTLYPGDTLTASPIIGNAPEELDVSMTTYKRVIDAYYEKTKENLTEDQITQLKALMEVRRTSLEDWISMNEEDRKAALKKQKDSVKVFLSDMNSTLLNANKQIEKGNSEFDEIIKDFKKNVAVDKKEKTDDQ